MKNKTEYDIYRERFIEYVKGRKFIVFDNLHVAYVGQEQYVKEKSDAKIFNGGFSTDLELKNHIAGEQYFEIQFIEQEFLHDSSDIDDDCPF